MPIASIILAGALAIVPKAPVQLTLDFAHVTTGAAYQIEINLFNKAGQRVGKVQRITLGDAATVEDVLVLFKGAMSDLDLLVKPIAGTNRITIIGTSCDFGRLEYLTLTRKCDKWIPDGSLKGPALVGKPWKHSPSFVLNPKPL